MTTTFHASTETLCTRHPATLSQSSIWGTLDTLPFIGSFISSGNPTPLARDSFGTIQVIADLPSTPSPLTDDEDDDEGVKFRQTIPAPLPTPPPTPLSTTTNAAAKSRPPHKRWISMTSMRKRQKKSRPSLEGAFPTIDAVLSHSDSDKSTDAELARRSSIESVGVDSINSTSESMKYVTGVRTATLSYYTLSGDSSLAIGDDTDGPTPYDPATLARMRTRRGLIEELLETEEGYISDLRSLLAMHHNLLGESSLAPKLENIRRTVQTLLEFHDRLLKELVLLFPASCRMAKDFTCEQKEKNFGKEVSHVLSGTIAVSGIARTFDKMIKDLYIYEEYAAQHSQVAAEIEERKGKIHHWRTLERGCEVLCISTMPGYSTGYEHGKRGATFDDLAMKPIQRICRYTLLLEQLLSATPSKDCPDANRLLEGVVHRLKEATAMIDQASNKELFPRMEKTWTLQRRLSLDSDTSFSFRLLGRNVLCGVLYATWLGATDVVGQYMICLLYKSYLLLATVSNGTNPRYVVKFAITLAFARVEEVATCSGMEVTASTHTFRLCFEHNHSCYEMLLTACNADEEDKWRDNITTLGRRANHEYYEYDSTFPTIPKPIRVDIVPITHFSSARRRPPHTRSSSNLPMVFGPTTAPHQVAILNTAARFKLPGNSSASQLPTRSASSSSTGITVLAPRPSERTTLENYLSDVWTTKHLTMGLMGRPGFNSNMRRFSVRSLSSLNSLPRSWSSSPGAGSRRGNSLDEDVLSDLNTDADVPHSAGLVLPPKSTFRAAPKRTRSAPDFSKATSQTPYTPVSSVSEDNSLPSGVQSLKKERTSSSSKSAAKAAFRTARKSTDKEKAVLEKPAPGSTKLRFKALETIKKGELGKSLKRMFGTKELKKRKASA